MTATTWTADAVFSANAPSLNSIDAVESGTVAPITTTTTSTTTTTTSTTAEAAQTLAVPDPYLPPVDYWGGKYGTTTTGIPTTTVEPTTTLPATMTTKAPFKTMAPAAPMEGYAEKQAQSAIEQGEGANTTAAPTTTTLEPVVATMNANATTPRPLLGA